MAALGEPHRFEVAMTLLEGPTSVGELTPKFGWPQSLVSHHIAILQQAGLVVMKREGRKRIYRLAEPREPGLKALLDIFRNSVREDAARRSRATGDGDRSMAAATSGSRIDSSGEPPEEPPGEGSEEPTGFPGPEIEDYLL
jgi:DNA-binding transcriptional ArsR family regulator